MRGPAIARLAHPLFMKSIHATVAHLCLLLCATAVSMSAHAQTSTVNLQFVSFPKAANDEPIELLLGEGRTMVVEIPTNSISKTYKVPALSTWSLGKSSTHEEGEFIFQIYGKVQSLGTTDQLILVIRKGRNDTDGLELTPLNNNPEGFSGGKYFLLNATSVDIAGTIGTGKFSLKPKQHDLIAPKPTKIKGDRKYCFAKFFFRKEEEVQPFFQLHLEIQ